MSPLMFEIAIFRKLDAGFHWLDSLFQSARFLIPETKISYIPKSGLPYKGRTEPVFEGSLAFEDFRGLSGLRFRDTRNIKFTVILDVQSNN